MFLLALIVVSLAAEAKDVEPLEAVKIAQRYVRLPEETVVKMQARKRLHKTNAPYYIFNDAQGCGFVVVAGDDDMGEVLAYGTEGVLDTLNANPGVRLLLESYRQTYDVLKQGNAPVKAAAHAGLYAQTVQPLLKTKWGQSYPFNAHTGYPYSGCVATAIAQMMYYYQWPLRGQGQAEYEVTYYHATKSADFSQSRYDWANMLPDYRYPVQATAEQESAVALLMSDVGIASFMQYTPSASGTQGFFAYQALQKNFDYTSAYVTRAMEGPSRFAEILRAELLNGCPVYLEGHPSGSASGHAWVADGFDENGLFHMNFGWEGQGDAYYSLTNLSLSHTGSEFQGKPLAFNRAITAILAHPNNGKFPAIDRGLMEWAPQLMFNEGGSFMLKDAAGKAFHPAQTLTLEMNSFVNRGKPFRGDIGVAVYAEEDSLVQVAYSDDHASGGLTQRIYGADQDGVMGSDYLINLPQPIRLSLSGLPDGYYRLVPVCVAHREDGSWDDFYPMKKAPIVEVELADGAGRISEVCSQEPLFQLMSQPRLIGQAEAGGKVQAVFTLKNLNGVPRDCYMRVKLLDENSQVVLSSRVDVPTEVEGCTQTDIPIQLSLPRSLAAGRYEVQLELSADEAETLLYPVNNIHDKDAAYIEVAEAKEKPLMAKAEVFLAGDSNDKIEGGSIDMSSMSLFKIGLLLRTNEDLTYEGQVALLTEDLQTGERMQVRGIDDYVTIHSSFDVPLFSYWLRQSNLPWADGHTYRFVVMGQTDGQDVELSVPDAPVYYLKREGNLLSIFTGAPTAVGADVVENPVLDISLAGRELKVKGSSLQALRLYDTDGRMLVRQLAASRTHASLSLEGLPAGLYLLRIESEGHSCTYRFLYRARE